MKTVLLALALLAAPVAASAQALQPGLAGLGFLLGRWTAAALGAVAETGGTSRGGSTFTSEAGGQAILRRDHVELRDAKGAHSGDFDILMMIWPEADGVHADYADGTHVIHYTRAEVAPGKSVTFSSAAAPGAPVFRLTYAVATPGEVTVDFGLLPPGGAPFQPIATGALRKTP